MKIRILSTICFLLSSFLLFAQTKRPQLQNTGNNGPGLSCLASYKQQVPDGVSMGFPDSVAASTTNYYWEGFLAGHSYSAEVYDPYDDATNEGNAVLSLLYDCSAGPSYTDASSMDPNLQEGFTDRISWIATSTATGYQIALQNKDAAGSHDYFLRIVDTTLFSPRWSTYGGFLTQWGFNNLTKNDISGVFTVLNAAGVVIKTVNVTAPAGKVEFYSSVPGDLNLPANDSGSVMFAYIGPAGAIQADAAIINTTATVIAPVKFEARNYQH